MRQTDYVILGLLGERPMSGYEIKKVVDIRFGFFWNESFGQIFPALKRLAKQGLIEETDSGAEGGHSRKLYRATPSGVAALQNWLALPVEKETYRLEILLKLYFSTYADPGVMLRHLAAFEESHLRQLEILNLFQKELEGILDADENHREILRVIDCGQKVNRAYLDWSRETMEYLEKKKGSLAAQIPTQTD
jgi:DNA-binding PadR family transcriptional regulator